MRLGLDALWRRSASGAQLVVVLFFVLELAYALLVPPLHNADETSHLRYAQVIEQRLQLPGAEVNERQQPPLFYLLAAVALRLGGNPTTLRLLSAVLAAIAVALIIAAARAFIPGHRSLATGAGAIIAALPVTASVGAAINNSALAWAAGAAMLWCIGSIIRSTASSVGIFLLSGLALGVGLVSKETDWPIAVVLAFVAGGRLRQEPTLMRSAGLVGLPLAISGWWFVRNLATFHGIVPPLQTITAEHAYLRSVSDLERFASGAVRTLFGPEMPDGGAIPRAAWARLLIGLLFAGLALLLVRACWLATRTWTWIEVRTRTLARALTAVCALVVVAWVLNSVFLALEPQARYLLVAAAAPATAMAWAAADLFRSRRLWVWLVAAAALLALIAVDADSLRVAIVRHA